MSSSCSSTCVINMFRYQCHHYDLASLSSLCYSTCVTVMYMYLHHHLVRVPASSSCSCTCVIIVLRYLRHHHIQIPVASSCSGELCHHHVQETVWSLCSRIYVIVMFMYLWWLNHQNSIRSNVKNLGFTLDCHLTMNARLHNCSDLLLWTASFGIYS